MSAHVVSRKTYAAVFVALLVLLVLTVAASYFDAGPWNAAVGLLIAASKAALISLYFMHLRLASPLTRVFAVAGLFWLALLLGLSFADIDTRDWISDQSPEAEVSAPASPRPLSDFGTHPAPNRPHGNSA